MQNKQVEELVLQSLEHEIGGERIYETALSCAINTDLKQEWEHYLDETRLHVKALEEVCRAMQIDAGRETPGRAVVRRLGQALEDAMKLAKSGDDREAAELVAAECVVLAETKDHLDWELLGRCGQHLNGNGGDSLYDAYQNIEDQEDKHLYHSRGFCRELWIKYLGMNAVLPPPEEVQKVKTAVGAAKAERSAEKQR
jgi:hypothetical protein